MRYVDVAYTGLDGGGCTKIDALLCIQHLVAGGPPDTKYLNQNTLIKYISQLRG